MQEQIERSSGAEGERLFTSDPGASGFDSRPEPLEPEDHVVPQRGAAILLALLRKHHVPQFDPVNRAQRRARGQRGHNYGLGPMAVPKTRKDST